MSDLSMYEIAKRLVEIDSNIEKLAMRARNANTQKYRDHLKEKFLVLWEERKQLWCAARYQQITGPSKEELVQRIFPEGSWVEGVFERPIRTTGELYGPNGPGWLY